MDEESGWGGGIAALPLVEYSPQAPAACRPRPRVLRGDLHAAAASAGEGTRLTWTIPEAMSA